MQLTGKAIINRGIVQNVDNERAIQMQGVDVRIDSIRSVAGWGVVRKQKTTLPESSSDQQIEYDENQCFVLQPGYYEVTLMEGVNVPDDITLHFKTRSSLVRCGAIVHSGQFDAGFHTDQAGCFLQVLKPIIIERGARIAQAICFETDKVQNLYDGQWQGDKQRK